jgi:hypothetical protein
MSERVVNVKPELELVVVDKEWSAWVTNNPRHSATAAQVRQGPVGHVWVVDG